MSVYVTQQPKPNRHNWVPNLEPATQYGALHFIFGAESQPYCHPRSSMLTAKKALANFDPEKDYVLCPNSGDPAALWCVLLALGSAGIDQVQMLYWNKPNNNFKGYYVPITFPINIKEPPHGNR
jgi:hypothetical protein